MLEPVSSPSRSVAIIRNPGARRPPSTGALNLALDAIHRSGWTSTLQDTASPGDASRLAREAAANGVEVVVVCGGDGTLNEAANGLIGADTALALIPGGTANVWAREMGIDSAPASALGLLGAGRRVRVDTGVVQIGEGPARHFMLMCSAGIDAEVVRQVELRPRVKRRLGRAAFGWPGVRSLFTRSVDTKLIVGGRERNARLLLALAGNTRLYGSVVRLADEALMDDGELDLVTFEDGPGGFGLALHRTRLLVRAMRGGLRNAHVRGISYTRAGAVELYPGASLPVQVDGEFIGVAGPDAPLRIWSAPRSLTVLLPGGVNPLLGRDSDR
jgi:YegS/Rv2252/BmrU family lipid kinase